MQTAVANPGNIVVPLSAILDQLQGKLSSAEIDSLFQAIVSRKKEQVRPGDLITADLMNQVLADLADLNVRVALLEGATSGPMILGRIPSGDVTALGKLTVLGTGFDPDPARNTVLLDTVAINSFLADSSATQLAFQIPDVFSSLPRLMDLSVRVGNRTSNILKIRVQPKTANQGGNVVIIPQMGELGEIEPERPYRLQWLVDSRTAIPTTYKFRLLFTDVSGASASEWQDLSELEPAGPRQIVLGKPLEVVATIQVPAAAEKAQIALEVQSTDGTITRTSDPIALVVGEAPEVSDPRAMLTLPNAIGPFDPGGGQAPDGSPLPNPLRKARITVDGNQLDGLQLRFEKTGVVPVTLFVAAADGAGTYAFSAEVEDEDGSAWEVLGVTPERVASVLHGQTLAVSVRFANTGAADASTLRYMVVRAMHFPSHSDATDFVSFIRFPIQGYTE
jgi:hypothetical protein